MQNYSVLLHKAAYHKADNYLNMLKAGARPGAYLARRLGGRALGQMSVDNFIECLLATKKPQVFAESAVCGDGSDWNSAELSILGDINIATPVTVYDDGRHVAPRHHEPPFTATLLFSPGALLRNGYGQRPADWQEVTLNGEIHPGAYCGLYERRLLPLLLYANASSARQAKPAFITVPGLGCGQFAGPFSGRLGNYLQQALEQLLQRHGARLPHLKALYYDPYRECDNERKQIQGIEFLIRPLVKGNDDRPQLCSPQTYEEPGDDFARCLLFSVVAWDHVSWPGNDFYTGARATDDGVKAAATSSMQAMTGVRGEYNKTSDRYEPPAGYRNWDAVVAENNLQLTLTERIQVFS